MIKRRSVVWIIGWLVVSLFAPWSSGPLPAAAQSGTITWSRPVNLSNTPQGSGHPAIIADAYGYVHVFWSEDMGGRFMRSQDPLPAGNSIFYTRWDGDSWTLPVDILSVPDDPIADFIAVTLDADNTLHAVWMGQANLYYSHAPSWEAFSARAWSEPVVLASDNARSSWPVSIVASASGDLHVIYATRGSEAGVYYTRSVGGKADWEMPIKLSAPLDALEESFSNVRIIIDGAGYLHAVWQTNQSEGYGQAIYYARSQDGGKSWSAPIQFGYRGPGDFDVGLPYLIAKGESELHLIYHAGQRPVGRYHRISQDGGETWSNPYFILPDMEGINGYSVPLVDSTGQMHLILDMRTRDTQVVGIYYARWLDTGWSSAMPLATEAPYGPSAHYMAATVRLGNELHVVWTQLHLGEIWHIRGLISGAPQTPALTSQVSQTLTPSPPGAKGPASAPAPTIRPTAWLSDVAVPASASKITNSPVLYSIGVPALLVLGLVVGLLAWAQRHS